MTRPPDWHSQLARVIATHDALPFAWGRSDCLWFVADAAEAMGAERLDRPRYSTERGGARALRRLGAADPHTLLASRFNEIPAATAGLGDIAALVDADGRACCGICVGAQVVAKATFGLARLPRGRMIRAFKV